MPFFCCDLLLRENLMLNKNCQRNSLGKTGPTGRKEGGKVNWFWNRVISPFQISDIRANKEKYQCYHSLHTFIIIKIKGQIKWCFKVKALKFLWAMTSLGIHFSPYSRQQFGIWQPQEIRPNQARFLGWLTRSLSKHWIELNVDQNPFQCLFPVWQGTIHKHSHSFPLSSAKLPIPHVSLVSFWDCAKATMKSSKLH